jgi:hypothetical protein
MYFCSMTLVDMLVVEMSLNPHLVVRVVEKQKIFFNPNPQDPLGWLFYPILPKAWCVSLYAPSKGR